jgi:hypothetical protein
MYIYKLVIILLTHIFVNLLIGFIYIYKIIKMSSTEQELSHISLGMTKIEYEECVMREIEFIHNQNSIINSQSSEIENKYHIDITYLTEYEFINLNLHKIQKFLNIKDIKPIGKYSCEILSDSIYRVCTTMSRDVVNEIIKCYKIINIQEISEILIKKYEN